MGVIVGWNSDVVHHLMVIVIVAVLVCPDVMVTVAVPGFVLDQVPVVVEVVVGEGRVGDVAQHRVLQLGDVVVVVRVLAGGGLAVVRTVVGVFTPGIASLLRVPRLGGGGVEVFGRQDVVIVPHFRTRVILVPVISMLLIRMVVSVTVIISSSFIVSPAPVLIMV